MTYKTIFIDSSKTKATSKWVPSTQINGDQLARDIGAAILEMEQSGYELVNSFPINSAMLYMSSYPYTYTEGVVMIFKEVLKES